MIANNPVRSPSLNDLIARLQAAKPELAARYGVRSLGLFGSHVRGEAGAGSDLDVLVEFATQPSLFQFVRLKNELSELLGLPVDLVIRSALKPVIGKTTLQEVIVV
ncbi:MAG: nucleotidyltransferase family protein [Chloroflexota bacterium]|jgi:uncharacterized protein